MVELGKGTTAPILGRDQAASWFAVPGAGDGPGLYGWVSGQVVTLQGDVFSVSVLPPAAPPLKEPALKVPMVKDPGLPPAGACVVIHPGEGQEVWLRLGPGEQFGVTALLGNWAEAVSSSMGWYQVLVGPGDTAWVEAGRVVLSGQCSAPPAEPCRANLPDGSLLVDARLGPGMHFGLAGVVDRQAEVIGREIGWLHVQLGPGQSGWVVEGRVALSESCER
jgi:hypothetical protein